VSSTTVSFTGAWGGEIGSKELVDDGKDDENTETCPEWDNCELKLFWKLEVDEDSSGKGGVTGVAIRSLGSAGLDNFGVHGVDKVLSRDGEIEFVDGGVG